MEYKIATRRLADQLELPRTFHYFLVVDWVEAGAFCCESYGVRITEEGGETVLLPALTVSAVRVDELITLLIEHHVGPAGLRDVVADWL